MNMWSEAFDELARIESEHGLTVDQRLRVAEIKALLAIGQELSLIQDQGVNPDWSHRAS